MVVNVIFFSFIMITSKYTFLHEFVKHKTILDKQQNKSY